MRAGSAGSDASSPSRASACAGACSPVQAVPSARPPAGVRRVGPAERTCSMTATTSSTAGIVMWSAPAAIAATSSPGSTATSQQARTGMRGAIVRTARMLSRITSSPCGASGTSTMSGCRCSIAPRRRSSRQRATRGGSRCARSWAATRSTSRWAASDRWCVRMTTCIGANPWMGCAESDFRLSRPPSRGGRWGHAPGSVSLAPARPRSPPPSPTSPRSPRPPRP